MTTRTHARARKGVRADEWEPRFLRSLAVHGVVSQAIKDAGIARSTAYLRRKKSAAFCTKWDEAIEEAIGAIELAVVTKALKGDMQTARWFLSRRRPQVYGDKVALEHSGAVQLEPVKLEVEWHGTDEGDDAD